MKQNLDFVSKKISIRQSEKMGTILSREDVERMIRLSNNPRDVSFIVFLYIFGCRVSEALMVNKEDIWIEGDYLFARINVLKRREVHSHIVQVSLNTPFISYLIGWWRTQNGKLWKVSRTTAWRIIKRLNPSASPHDFRHTRLNRIVMKGANAMQLQIWAGWKNLQTADDYIKSTSVNIKSLADKID